MSFVEHLRELRKRILWSVVVVFVLTLAAFHFREELFAWITAPLKNISDQRMQVLGLVEMFVTYLKLSVLAAVFAGAPFMLTQAWLFISPGLYKHERRWLLPFVVLGTIFFIGGGSFAFYVVLPLGFDYLVHMVPESIEANFRVADYVGFVIQMLLVFGLVFELPLVMWILGAAQIVAPASFSRLRKYWIVLAFVISAVLTPPDPVTQIIMAVPLLLFFEVGILGAKIFYRGSES